MPTTIKYNTQFTTKLGRRVEIQISDGTEYDNTIPLICTSARLAYKDGDREKYVPIRSSELTFSVLCNSDLPAETFLTTSADQLQVTLLVNDVVEWKGWLDSSGLQKPLKDVNHPVQLVAKDGLHLLANRQIIAPTNTTTYPDGTYNFYHGNTKLIEYIAECLSYTFLSFDIYSYVNIFPSNADPSVKENDPFNLAYVNASTFYVDSKQLETCYEILNKIMHSFKCTLFQAKGRWNIVYWEQIFDSDGGLNYGTKYDADGVPDIGISYESKRISLGVTEPYKLINNDALITWEPALEKVTTNFRYDQPVTPIFNSTMAFKGALLSVSGATKRYELVGWSLNSGTGTWGLVERYTAYNNMLEAYISNADNNIRSPWFLVAAYDKISMTFAFSSVLTSGTKIAVTLSGTAGTHWLKSDGTWSTSPYWTINNPGQKISIENVDPIPFEGYIYIDFLSETSGLGGKFINEISTNIELLISDGKKKASGYYVSRYLNAKQLNETVDDIYISDSLNRGVKGCLLDSSDGEALVLSTWKRNDNEEELSFQDIINEATWKMKARSSMRLEGRIRNIYEESLLSPLMLVNHTSFPTKQFQLCTIDMDLKDETAECTLVECYDTEITLDTPERKTGLINPQDLPNEPTDSKKPLSWRWGPTGVIIQLITKKRWGKIR